MLLVAGTTAKLQVITGQAVNTDVHVSYADYTGSTVSVNEVGTLITTATTTDVTGSPSGTDVRNVKTLNIRNRSTSTSVDITVVHHDGTNAIELVKLTLYAGQTLQYVEGKGWDVGYLNTAQLVNESVASQTPFSSDTYLVGSNILLPAPPVVGTMYRLIFDVTKTNVGTAGTTGDTARCTLTFGPGTAAVDSGTFDSYCVFRTVGTGTSAIIQGISRLTSNLTTTGISNAVKSVQNTGGGFDSTVAASIIGASYNGGASAAHTIQLVRAEWIP